MKKKILLRGLLGFPLAIMISFIFSIIISACIGDGCYYPATPELVHSMGNELNAVIIQGVLSGIMGMGFGMASVIWEMDSWSLAKQTGIYFLIISVLMLPIAYILNWMEHSLGGFLSYFVIFVGIFICIWLSQYLCWKRKIREMNDCIRNKEDDNHMS